MPDKNIPWLQLGTPPLLGLRRYRLRFQEGSPGGQPSLRSPHIGYSGSAWRGAFGHALKQSICVTGLSDCGVCALLHSCPYPFVFENRTPPDTKKLALYPRTPNPYVLEPADHAYDLDGETVNLGLTLFGRANAQIPHIVEALKLAGRGGLTARRVKTGAVGRSGRIPRSGRRLAGCTRLGRQLGGSSLRTGAAGSLIRQDPADLATADSAERSLSRPLGVQLPRLRRQSAAPHLPC